MTNALPLAKVAAQMVAGLGVSKIVVDIVKNNVTVVTTADAVKVWTGSVILSGLVVEQSSNYIERATNEVVTACKRHKLKIVKTETE